MEVNREHQSYAQSIRKSLANFGLPRIIITALFIFLFILAGIYGMNLPSFFGDVLRRWGMFGVLVLAMVPSIQSGIGPNFGLPVGIVGGMLGALLSIELRYAGRFDFVTNQTLSPIVGALVAIFIGVIIATFMGILYGMLLNKVKGSEMAISAYVGFSAVALFCIVWALIPLRANIAILPGMGRGMRQAVNLQDDFRHAFNNLLQFNIGDMTVPTGLLLLFFFACFCMWLFTKSRLGMMMSAAGANPEYARASGINVDRMRILGTTISTAFGAFGIVVYAQSFGFLQLYVAPLMFGFLSVAAVLIGGASVRRARVFDVLFGTFVFQGILTIALPLVSEILPPEARAGVPEMLRLIVTNGIILYALSKAKGGR